MIYLEAGLFAILAVLFLHTSTSDIKSGRISNKSILIALGVGFVCVICYYAFFATDCLLAYFINIGISIIISLILYALGIWGAGDSKLLVATIVLFPARIYCLNNQSMASCFLLIAIIFISAFLYVIIDTLFLGIRKKNLFEIPKREFDWKSYIKGFLFFFLLISLANAIIYLILPTEIILDSILLTAIHFVLILIGMRLSEKANWYVVLVMGIMWIASVLLGISHISSSDINWISYLFVIALMLFRLVADKYNYKTILVTELKPGMILSVGSVLAFARSRVSGLPQYTSEDLKSRISSEEVESIMRWSNSKNGQDTITIVRKIPFALFIAIGTVLFTLLEVLGA
ncbi:MAG: prepilin peptidase [Eubacteriales bacterium]|jgi:preflagellin peptidase FlaK